MKALKIVIVMWSVALASGCAGTSSPYLASEPSTRDTARAERLTREAADLIGRDPEQAEALLRAALAADLYHGPAHNNLGVVFLARGRLYEAANEFEWARKLMPGRPGPRLNLGLALERGGRIDDAIGQYEAALESAPEHLGATQAVVRCQIRHGLEDGLTGDRLRLIAERGSERWRSWARERLLMASEDPGAG